MAGWGGEGCQLRGVELGSGERSLLGGGGWERPGWLLWEGGSTRGRGEEGWSERKGGMEWEVGSEGG